MNERKMNRQKLWEALTSRLWQVEQPVFPAVALKRITISSKNEPLRLFTPWGPPYNKKGFNIGRGPELKTIKKLATIDRLFTVYGVSIEWIFLWADTYGTEINKLGNLDGPPRIKEEIVTRYFFNLKKSIASYIPKATCYLWSEIRAEYKTVYLIYQQEYSDERIKQLIGESLFKQMAHAAKLINRLNSSTDAEIMAIRYLRERVCEALLGEEIWHPIKISLAPKKNDEVVDMELPRLYLIPPELQTPWLKNLK